MVDELRNGIETEATYMKFFEKFDGMTPQEAASCKAVSFVLVNISLRR
jgi:hypothetical protein